MLRKLWPLPLIAILAGLALLLRRGKGERRDERERPFGEPSSRPGAEMSKNLGELGVTEA